MDPGHLDLVFVIGVGLVIWGLVSLVRSSLRNRRTRETVQTLESNFAIRIDNDSTLLFNSAKLISISSTAA